MSFDKGHYLDLFRYNSWANTQLLRALRSEAAPPPEKALAFMSHLLRAQQVWLGRVQGSAAATMPFWKSDTLADCIALNEASTLAWSDHLDRCDAADLERPIGYTNSKGVPFDTPLHQIATHVINHSTHHRAQIATLLRQAGAIPPPTDYIVYTRQ